MKYILKILRGIKKRQYFEEFELEYIEGANVISALMQIQKNPINNKGEKVSAVSWDMGCLEEVCGACSMIINGKPRQACTALIKDYINDKNNVITLAPLSKFPVIKDLVTDRKVLFQNLKHVKAWIDADGSHDRGFGPKINQSLRDALYILSTCMSCGCCMEACPQYNNKSKFIGPAAISQARLFNSHPIGKMQKAKRLRPLLEEGGIADCGNAQNCIEVCPKEIPLTESIAKIGRDATKQAFRDFFCLEDS